jgi:hypothetical protein
MDAISSKIVGLTAYRNLEMTDDLSIYGLDAPSATLTVKDSQGSALTLSFGNFNNGKYYVLAEGLRWHLHYRLHRIRRGELRRRRYHGHRKNPRCG